MVSLTHFSTTNPSSPRDRLRRFLGVFLFTISVLTVAGIAGMHRFMVAALGWVLS